MTRPSKEQVDAALEMHEETSDIQDGGWCCTLAHEVRALREELRADAKVMTATGDRPESVDVALKYAPRVGELPEDATIIQKSHLILAYEVVELRATIARVETVAGQCNAAVASFAEAAALPENDYSPTARALKAAVDQVVALLRGALRGEP